MSKINEILAYARQQKCSDVHISEGENIKLRKDGNLFDYFEPIDASLSSLMIESIIPEYLIEAFQHRRDLDFVYVDDQNMRYRVNIFRQQYKVCAAIRVINEEILSIEQLNLPPVLKELAMAPNGLVLITGPTGSGKSTSLAAIIDYINEHRSCHILTVEDPVEYVYKQKQALIHQREIGADVSGFDEALRSAMREDPDVILVGEMRDYETMSAAITLAETGHLVFSTLHTIGAAKTIDRIIDVFPSEKQEQIRMQLSGVINAVITQTLLPKADGTGRIAGFEIMIGTDAIKNLIRKKEIHQIDSVIQTGKSVGMQSLNFSLAQLVRERKVLIQDAQKVVKDLNEFNQFF
ncbi:MAG: type IV pilus twitching motility protein PilT [Beduini sp.]|uniref:type IV pilus twitching motility protein PilT n=1 Tax=Beduini sp. TaxID=1922300 RepID=UPI0011C9CD7F